MTLDEKNKIVQVLKDKYRTKPITLFSDKYPDAITPSSNIIINYLAHTYLGLLIIDNILYGIKLIIGRDNFLYIYNCLVSIF